MGIECRPAQQFGDHLVATENRQTGAEATPITADVTRYDDMARVIAHTVTTYGRIDLALNNAGINPRLVDVHEIDIADWAQVIDINLTGILHSMKAELTHMLDNGGGAIVNMASTAGLMAHAGRAASSASKHGIIGLTRSAAVEYAQRGIRIHAVAPGPIDAPPRKPSHHKCEPRIAAKTAMNRACDRSSVVRFGVCDRSGARRR